MPARREVLEARHGQLEKSRDRRPGCQRTREHRCRRNLRQAEELAEEASLGQKLVAKDVAHRYREAGVDGIILSERLAREAGFPADDGVSQALIEQAAE